MHERARTVMHTTGALLPSLFVALALFRSCGEIEDCSDDETKDSAGHCCAAEEYDADLDLCYQPVTSESAKAARPPARP